MFGGDEVEQLRSRRGFRLDPVGDVGSVEARDEVLGILEVESFGEFGVGGRSGRGRQCDARDIRESFGQDAESQIVAAEVMSPLGHAVGFVDGEQGDLCLLEQSHRPRQDETLGREVEQVDLSGEQLLFDLLGGLEIEGRVEIGRPHAEVLQRRDLIGHERNEWGDDDTCTGPDQGRNLIAQGFSAAGGHEYDRIPAADDLVDDGRLLTPELLIAEDIVEDIEGGGRGCGGHGTHPSSRH